MRVVTSLRFERVNTSERLEHEDEGGELQRRRAGLLSGRGQARRASLLRPRVHHVGCGHPFLRRRRRRFDGRHAAPSGRQRRCTRRSSAPAGAGAADAHARAARAPVVGAGRRQAVGEVTGHIESPYTAASEEGERRIWRAAWSDVHATVGSVQHRRVEPALRALGQRTSRRTSPCSSPVQPARHRVRGARKGGVRMRGRGVACERGSPQWPNSCTRIDSRGSAARLNRQQVLWRTLHSEASKPRSARCPCSRGVGGRVAASAAAGRRRAPRSSTRPAGRRARAPPPQPFMASTGQSQSKLARRAASAGPNEHTDKRAAASGGSLVAQLARPRRQHEQQSSARRHARGR